MVAKITSGAAIYGALYYNQEKVEKGKGFPFGSHRGEEKEHQAEAFGHGGAGEQSGVTLEVQQYPVHHAVGTTGGMEERIAEIIDVHHEKQDADRPHEVDGLAEPSGIFLCHMGYDWLLYVNTSLVDPRAFPPYSYCKAVYISFFEPVFN
jgi:hypothetical protein